MKKTLTKNDFINEFAGSDRKDQLSYEGLEVIFDYLEQITPDSELDIIAICCEFSEYKSMKDLQEDYPDIETISDLQDKTTVLQTENGHIIIVNF